MIDGIFESWLEGEYLEAMSFAQRSEMLNLAPVAGTPPYRYIAEFNCDGLAMIDGRVTVVDRHLVGINFPGQYLREKSDPGRVLTWLEPETEFHPNISAPFCCVGPIPPGMGLLTLLYQLYQMISYQRFTPKEDDALNDVACRWARNNIDRFPIDPRRSMLDSRPAVAGHASAEMLRE